MYKNLIEKKSKISIVGLGYVGLPIALELANHFSVIGFDISERRIELMKKGIDPSKELSSESFKNKDIHFTSSQEVLKEAVFHIVAVPTPIDKNNLPDLTPLKKASETVGNVLKKGDYVVYESTVFPGATEEVCIPILEEKSGLKFPVDFKVGYSPERINPGDTVHTLTNVVKVVSGCCEDSLEEISKVYETIIKPGVHRASSIKVAEAAKIIENTQRDLNIALMNELSMIFNKMNINTYEVLEAAGTKWNFLKFSPGLVGGHCIGVDPYYLTFKANELGHFPRIISAGRAVNAGLAKQMVSDFIKKLIKLGKNISTSKVLVMGITFKEDVSDIRNSKVADVVHELDSFGINTQVIDPYADPDEVKKEYGIELISEVDDCYDGIILAVAHKEYVNLDEKYFNNLCCENAVFFDVKGIYHNKLNNISYMSL